MALPSSGPLSLNDIATEFGGSTPHSLSEYYAGGGLVSAGTSGTYGPVPSSGTISIQNFYGTSASVGAPYFIGAFDQSPLTDRIGEYLNPIGVDTGGNIYYATWRFIGALGYGSFISKYANDLTPIWSYQLGTDGDSSNQGISTSDGSGNTYYFRPFGGYPFEYGYLFKINSSGVVQWQKRVEAFISQIRYIVVCGSKVFLIWQHNEFGDPGRPPAGNYPHVFAFNTSDGSLTLDNYLTSNKPTTDLEIRAAGTDGTNVYIVSTSNNETPRRNFYVWKLNSSGNVTALSRFQNAAINGTADPPATPYYMSMDGAPNGTIGITGYLVGTVDGSSFSQMVTKGFVTFINSSLQVINTFSGPILATNNRQDGPWSASTSVCVVANPNNSFSVYWQATNNTGFIYLGVVARFSSGTPYTKTFENVFYTPGANASFRNSGKDNGGNLYWALPAQVYNIGSSFTSVKLKGDGTQTGSYTVSVPGPGSLPYTYAAATTNTYTYGFLSNSTIFEAGPSFTVTAFTPGEQASTGPDSVTDGTLAYTAYNPPASYEVIVP